MGVNIPDTKKGVDQGEIQTVRINDVRSKLDSIPSLVLKDKINSGALSKEMGDLLKGPLDNVVKGITDKSDEQINLSDMKILKAYALIHKSDLQLDPTISDTFTQGDLSLVNTLRLSFLRPQARPENIQISSVGSYNNSFNKIQNVPEQKKGPTDAEMRQLLNSVNMYGGDLVNIGHLSLENHFNSIVGIQQRVQDLIKKGYNLNGNFDNNAKMTQINYYISQVDIVRHAQMISESVGFGGMLFTPNASNIPAAVLYNNYHSLAGIANLFNGNSYREKIMKAGIVKTMDRIKQVFRETGNSYDINSKFPKGMEPFNSGPNKKIQDMKAAIFNGNLRSFHPITNFSLQHYASIVKYPDGRINCQKRV